MTLSRFTSRILSVTALLVACGSIHAADYETTARKAQRFFDDREWASAHALYGLMLDQRHDADSVYVRAIVASSMMHRDQQASALLSDAMNAGVSFSRLMAGVKDVSFAIGEPAVYEGFLELSQRDCPWLARAIDDELLNYYLFRNDGQHIIVYARKMLAGLPDSVRYLSALGKGYACIGDFKNAVATWLKIIEISPDDYDTLLKLGNYFNLIDEHSDALIYLSRAEAIRPTPYVARLIESLKAKSE